MEIVTVYFEDPCVRACMMNHAVQHGVWGFTTTHEKEFRKYAALRQQHLAARAAERAGAGVSAAGSQPGGDSGAGSAGGEGGFGPSQSDSESDDGGSWSAATMRAQLGGGSGGGESPKWRRHAFTSVVAFLAARFLARR